jgi:hypothetical protein
MSKFLQFDHIIHCEFPDSRQLQTAFLNLPDTGRVEVTCSMADLVKILSDLTRIGFFGIRILISDMASPLAKLIAFKGKSGPCYDTGRTATYTGSAIAALDDDSHLLFGPTPVCEKTAAIYFSKIYQDVVKISEPEPGLIAKLESNPEPFNCDNFEENMRRLAENLTSSTSPTELNEVIFYPGPFQTLILADGTILKRGQPTSIDRSYVSKLQKSDLCILFPGVQNAYPVSADFFQDVYSLKGLLSLIETENFSSTIHHSDNINFKSLDKISKRMRLRLQKVISGKENYFILTGSDPWDIYGCCPSEEIGVANRLVEAGILEAWKASKQKDSCSTTVYAFNQEIQNKAGKPSFTPNTLFREQVLKQIAGNQHLWQKYVIVILRPVLLLFAIVAIIFSIYNAPEMKADITSNYRSAIMDNEDIVMVYVSHFGISCQVCENMKMLTQQTMKRYFSVYIDAKKLKYQTINMDDPGQASLVNFFNLYSNAVVFSHEKNGKIVDHKIIKDRIWMLSDSDSEFTEMIREELKLFMNKIN